MLGSVLKNLLRKNRADASTADWLVTATSLHRAGRHAEAAAVCHQRLANAPNDGNALQALAAALLAQGRSTEALTCLERVAEHMPGGADLHANIATIRSARREFEAALASYARALLLRPEWASCCVDLVSLLKGLERYDEAEDRCRMGLAHARDSGALRHALAGVLFEQGRVPEAIDELKAALAIDPSAAEVHSDLLRALNYAWDHEPAAVFREHVAWAERHAAPLASAAPHTNDPGPARQLKVGYVSPYFRKHAVTFFLESTIEHHNRAGFEIVLYADVQQPDEYSERLKSYGARWRSTVGLSDAALAQLVREDAIDILVDLSGHTPHNRLLAFARRPAPIQVTWNGYPNTTGMRAMTHRITDEYCDPPGMTEALHTERLVRLPGIYMSWRPPADAPEPGLLPALATSRVTFGSFNSCFKITAEMMELWSRVLSSVPGSRLIVMTVTGERAAARIRAGFAACGIDTDRLDIRGRVTHESFLAAHREVDIALDTYPYHGTTTTCFSLWMGVPVVTLAGATHVSRVGVSLLAAVGLDRLCAHDRDEYVQIAARLAGDVSALATLRSDLRRRVSESRLTDGAACARSLEAAYRDIWASWCASRLLVARREPPSTQAGTHG